MKWDDIAGLLERYYAGESTLEEEEQLRKQLQHPERLPEGLRADAEMFLMMHALSKENSKREMILNEEVLVVPVHPTRSLPYVSWTGRIAAGFAILVIGVFAGWLIGKEGSGASDVAQLREDMNQMKQIMVLSQLRNQSASNRIMATYEFKKLDTASDEILDALINTLNIDDNTNVKLAAAEALFKFGNRDKVRKAFIKGLNSQSDPVLQIKLIDMLVGLKEKRALPSLQQMMQSEGQMEAVKQKAAQGIGKLL